MGTSASSAAPVRPETARADEVVRVSGFSGTVIWAAGYLLIEHNGAAQRLGAPASVRIREQLVTGTVVQEPTLVRNGLLQIRVAGVDHLPMEPGDPYTVVFTRRSAAAVRDLRDQIAAATERG